MCIMVQLLKLLPLWHSAFVPFFPLNTSIWPASPGYTLQLEGPSLGSHPAGQDAGSEDCPDSLGVETTYCSGPAIPANLNTQKNMGAMHRRMI